MKFKKHIFILFYILICLILFISGTSNFFPEYFIYISLFLTFIPILISAIKQLKEKQIGNEFFLVIAFLVALIAKEELAINVILLIMLIAKFLEYLIEDKANKAISSLITLIPNTVIELVNGYEKVISIKDVVPGMIILVKTGGRVPVDGVIDKGIAEINESSLTGESILKRKGEGDKVFAGTFLESGSINIKVAEVGENTFFGKIKNLIEKSDKFKSRISSLTKKIATILVPMLLFIFGIIWLISGDLQLIITLLVFGSPLELTLITPLTILTSVAAAFKQGILVKGGLVLERFASIDSMIFDKTGTLTSGQPQVVEIKSLNKRYSQKDILQIAAIAEKKSGHPIAQAIFKKALEEKIVIDDPTYYHSITGHGIEIRFDQKIYYVGSKHFIQAPEHGNIKFIEPELEQIHSSFYVASKEDGICGKISISDTIRPEAKEVVQLLKGQGIKHTYILSGDNQNVVNSVAKEVAIEHAVGNLFPDQKIDKIKSLQNNGHIVAMIGDGINDAPAIAQADVGIALGAMGMEPAIDAADIVLMTNDLNKIAFVYQLSKKTLDIIKQNIFIGFVLVHTIGMFLAFLGYISAIEAAIFHAIEDIAILINSIRLLNFKPK